MNTFERVIEPVGSLKAHCPYGDITGRTVAQAFSNEFGRFL